MPTGLSLVLFLLSFSTLFSFSTAQGEGTTRCADSGLDWYVKGTGETPCKTYERLRQICNSGYRVGKLNPNTPPDTCNEQVASCCCNSVSFALSMLCLTCQRGVGSSGIGIDAGVGAYQMYLNAGRSNNQFCSPQVNKTLPADIQNAVCNNDIKIYNGLYNLFWGDGAWFYVYTSQTLTKDQNADPNTVLGKCPKPQAPPPPPPPTTSSTSTTAPTTSTTTTSTFTTANQDPTTTQAREKDSTTTSTSTTETHSNSSTGSSLSQTTTAVQFAGNPTTSGSRSTTPSTTDTGVGTGSTNHSETGSESGAASNFSNGAIAGIVMGCLALVTAMVVVLLYCRRRKHAHARAVYATSPDDAPYADSRTGLNVAQPHRDLQPQRLSSSSPPPPPFVPMREKDRRRFLENTGATASPSSGHGDDDGFTNSDRPTSDAYTMTTTTVTDMLMMERHVDAGPIAGSSLLNRARSGRLPPAYGDLVREAEGASMPMPPLVPGVEFGVQAQEQKHEQAEGSRL